MQALVLSHVSTDHRWVSAVLLSLSTIFFESESLSESGTHRLARLAS